jgi:hypothetical protein
MDKIEIDDEVLKLFEQDLLESWAAVMNDKISSVIESFSYKNFLGSAAEYLSDNGLEITPEIQKNQAEILVKNFKNDAKNLIFYDKESRMVKIHEDLAACEYGDYYHPAMKLITGAMELIIKDNV